MGFSISCVAYADIPMCSGVMNPAGYTALSGDTGKKEQVNLSVERVETERYRLDFVELLAYMWFYRGYSNPLLHSSRLAATPLKRRMQPNSYFL